MSPAMRASAAVLGSPIAHSLSPVLHMAAYRELGLDWEYHAVECPAGGLASLLRTGAGQQWLGASVTMPLKQEALDFADRATELAVRVGGANTLVRSRGQWHADNTDVGGVIGALGEVGVHRVESACIVGAGATAAAALAAVHGLGATAPEAITVLVRNQNRASELVEAAWRMGASVRVRSLDEAAHCLDVDVVVSTVPAGAADAHAETVAASGVPVLDVVYAPWPTTLATAVTTAGGTVVGGFSVLLHQAVLQVVQMTGCAQAPVVAMRAAGEAELRRRAAT